MNAKLPGLLAILGTSTVVITTVVGGLMVPGYSHMSQFISELGARDSTIEMPVRFAGFLLAGVLLSLFSVGAFLQFPRSPATLGGFVGLFLYASGYTVAAFFPCDPGCRPAEPSMSQLIHNMAGLLGYVAAPISLMALGSTSKHWVGGAYLSPVGYLAAFLALLGLTTLDPASPYVGISQRVIELGVLGWVSACGYHLVTKLEPTLSADG